MNATKQGIIEIPFTSVSDIPEEIAKMFAMIGFLPFFIHKHLSFGIYSYYGTCKQFKILHVGDIIPKYNLNCTYKEFVSGKKKLIKVEVV